MASIIISVKGVPDTPAAGTGRVLVNSSSKRLQVINDAGFRRSLGIGSFSDSSQVLPLGDGVTESNLSGSLVTFPAGFLQIGTCFRWTFNITKAAGAAITVASLFRIWSQALSATVCEFSKPGASSVADQGTVIITAIVRGPLSASGVVAGHFRLAHNLVTTGLSTVSYTTGTAISSGFNVTSETGFSILTIPGNEEPWTITHMIAEAWNL